MIERVARAIAGHFGSPYDDLPKNGQQRREWRRNGEVHDNSQQDMLQAAYSAIESMRDPTRQMWEVGAGDFASDDPELNAISTWQAMIDKALRKEPKWPNRTVSK